MPATQVEISRSRLQDAIRATKKITTEQPILHMRQQGSQLHAKTAIDHPTATGKPFPLITHPSIRW